MPEKEELIQRLMEIQEQIKLHYVDADSVQYCDDRSSTILEVSNEGKDEEGRTIWSFHFNETGDIFQFHDTGIEEE